MYCSHQYWFYTKGCHTFLLSDSSQINSHTVGCPADKPKKRGVTGTNISSKIWRQTCNLVYYVKRIISDGKWRFDLFEPWTILTCDEFVHLACPHCRGGSGGSRFSAVKRKWKIPSYFFPGNLLLDGGGTNNSMLVENFWLLGTSMMQPPRMMSLYPHMSPPRHITCCTSSGENWDQRVREV